MCRLKETQYKHRRMTLKWIFKDHSGGLNQIYMVKDRVKRRNCVNMDMDMGIKKCRIFLFFEKLRFI